MSIYDIEKGSTETGFKNHQVGAYEVWDLDNVS